MGRAPAREGVRPLFPVIAIAIGDPAGIGPEVTAKALQSELPADDARYTIFGDHPLVREFKSDRVRIVPVEGALPCVKAGAEMCLRGDAKALVTAPLSKEAVIRAGHKDFVGQTEYLSALSGTTKTAMMLLGADDRGRWLRVVLATTHLPLRNVAQQLTQAKVELAIELASRACEQLGLARRRIAVCGLNPHAGEGGNLGTEEQTVITPAVEASKGRGLDVHGPFAADALFYYVFRGDYDAVVAMYHDQGLVPLKMVGFERGVNWTLGLPFVRTSPDHGTAFDIAGKNIANPSSMTEAIRLAKKLAAG
jgi:4-phospho-D-threonate 3-dehydrogenase / 4-phospho-D-erythronate 3-dehydrogenase